MVNIIGRSMQIYKHCFLIELKIDDLRNILYNLYPQYPIFWVLSDQRWSIHFTFNQKTNKKQHMEVIEYRQGKRSSHFHSLITTKTLSIYFTNNYWTISALLIYTQTNLNWSKYNSLWSNLMQIQRLNWDWLLQVFSDTKW